MNIAVDSGLKPISLFVEVIDYKGHDLISVHGVVDYGTQAGKWSELLADNVIDEQQAVKTALAIRNLILIAGGEVDRNITVTRTSGKQTQSEQLTDKVSLPI